MDWNETKTYYLLILFSITVLNLLLFLTPASAVDQSQTLIAAEDATIDLDNPTTNYGGSNILEVGYSTSWMGAYIKFDVSNVPANFHTIQLKLEFISVETTTIIDIYEASNIWSELTITWANAPSRRALVTSGSIAEGIIYVFDVTTNYQSESGYWSIYITSIYSNRLTLASKQCFSWYEPPTLVFHFTDTNLPLIIGGIVALAIGIPVACGLVFYIYRKRHPKVPLQVTKRAQVVNQPRQQQKPLGIQEELKYCGKCGQPSNKSLSFCTECGNKF